MVDRWESMAYHVNDESHLCLYSGFLLYAVHLKTCHCLRATKWRYRDISTRHHF
uniref:Uncharacterized protein n=1 Tax=Anguilla anguilla TaxID=7936 RepID=A0A0E9SDR5_ANGAN